MLGQVEEKRRRKEREIAAKREEDEVERRRVIRVLAEERAANRSRYEEALGIIVIFSTISTVPSSCRSTLGRAI